VQLGSLVGDALWAVLGLVGIGLLLQLDWLRWPIGVAGTLYLLWLARDAWRAASVEFLVAGDAGVTQRSATRAGVLLSVTNPQNIAYWAALGSAMGAVGVHEPSATDYGIFFAGFMVSSVVWAFVCAAIVDRLFARSGQQWAKLTYRLCAVAFVALALGTLRDLIAPAELQPAKAKAGVSAPK
jgi:chemosensory pili system protein ChpE/L-lysine exporter family protein LysE/ArgO